jgi:hypothetical protein
MGMSMSMVAITSISKKLNDRSYSAPYETLVALFLSDQNCSIPIGKPIPDFELEPGTQPQYESGQLRTMKNLRLR